MNKRSFLFLPTVILLSPLFAADPVRNPDVIAQGAGGTWATTTTGGGSTSYVPSAPMPKGPEITPNYGTNAPQNGGKSSSFSGGLLGFFFNLGKKSPKDIESERIRDGIDKALSKAQAGIPLNSADYAALGTADLSKAPVKTAVGVVKTIATSAPAPVVSTPVPPVENPVEVIKTIAPAIGKYGITCKAPIPFDSGDLPSIATKVPSLAEKMQALRKVGEPTLLKDNPFKDLVDMGSGGGVAGGVMKVVGGGAAAKTAVTTVVGAVSGAGTTATTVGVAGGGTVTVGTAAGATAVGGTAAGGTAAGGTAAAGTAAGGTATTTTLGGALVTAAPYVAVGAAAVGITAGIAAVFDYYFPNEHNIFFKERYQQKLRNEAAKNQSQGGGSSSPNPKKPDDEKKERKFNTVQKTDALRKIKENYRYDKQINKYILKENGKPYKCHETGKDVNIIDWDGAHGDIEAYFGKKNHLGSLDPETFRIYKKGVPNRKT